MMDVTFSQALEGYYIHVESRRLSDHTIKAYKNVFQKFAAFIGSNTGVDDITKSDIEGFINSFPTLSKKSLRNYHGALSALWTWLVEEDLARRQIVAQVKAPKPEEVAIVPFTEQDIKLMLIACDKSKLYQRSNQNGPSCHRNIHALRNKTIIYVLLDCGLRASELCELKIGDVDLPNKRLQVWGKGAKERVIPFSGKTARMIWRYKMEQRGDGADREPLFVSAIGEPIGREALRTLIHRLGDRAGVRDAHPHRFRHTFAIQFLRNNGDLFSLQTMLGHSDLSMTRRYSRIAQADVENKHKVASPVSNWNLG